MLPSRARPTLERSSLLQSSSPPLHYRHLPHHDNSEMGLKKKADKNMVRQKVEKNH
jgi:hypothetical protein